MGVVQRKRIWTRKMRRNRQRGKRTKKGRVVKARTRKLEGEEEQYGLLKRCLTHLFLGLTICDVYGNLS